MNKSDAEKIDLILDEHEKTFRKQNHLYIMLGSVFFITSIFCMIITFCVSGTYLKYLCLFLVCSFSVCGCIFYYYTLLPGSRMVLNRQEVLRLIRLTEDVPDVRQELLNRLLSGKKLTVRDEEDIRRLWQEKMDAINKSATRQFEQETIQKFVCQDK
ncbi:hypothetical protein FEG98_24125 [Escherichia coli]|uniref:hypothetical protein n=1 Tax=Escherichia coli TaxID=562 RepID=UPI000BE1CFD3|nr:hypothetical protein [Escherichia coli]ECM1490608.1 hypothetical protein [Salmonella enterica subsp. enterica serovar Newport]EDY9279187.1 hypothetical protein [Salmonella enterica]EAC1329142.1 hypothetical protein [Escherichia coli]ECM1839394.1 hypothetical protein [Salmonella enterica subsp. enterica serovar Newport]ECM1909192.1 hypothetical protein [Salmonella enterica subsp. enterica serovar Newport]